MSSILISAVIMRLTNIFLLVYISRYVEPKLFGYFGLGAIFVGLFKLYFDSVVKDTIIYFRGYNGFGFLEHKRLFYFTALFLISLCLVAVQKLCLIDDFLLLCVSIMMLGLIVTPVRIFYIARLEILREYRVIAGIDITSILLMGFIVTFVFHSLGRSDAGLILPFQFVVLEFLSCGLSLLVFHYFKKFPFKKADSVDIVSTNDISMFHNDLLKNYVVNYVFDNLDKLMVFSVFGSVQAAFYQRAQQLSGIGPSIWAQSISRVVYSSFARGSADEIQKSYFMTLHYTILVAIPILGLLMVNPTEIVVVLMGDKWVGMVEYFGPLVVISSIQMFSHQSVNSVKTQGRSKSLLRLNYITKSFITVAIIIGVVAGPAAFLYFLIVSKVISFYLSCSYAIRYWDVSFYNVVIFIILRVPVAVLVVALGYSMLGDLLGVDFLYKFFFFVVVVFVMLMLVASYSSRRVSI